MIDLATYQSGKWYPSTSGYKYFVPNLVDTQWIWSDVDLNSLLENAAIKLGELNSIARLVPNVDLFLQLHLVKEAVISSRIEGTQTQIDEALLEEEDIAPERRNDWREVNNYIQALRQAIGQLEALPISSRLIRSTHRILLKDVRGQERMPGDFRTSQNWIGGRSIADATFIPPHHSLVSDLMGDLEKFIHNDRNKIPELVKIAIAHYQFETIHPFLDGNGRIGRLLITLFLVERNLLTKPLLYLSRYFERNKGLYYDNLTSVRNEHTMTDWIKYFLIGIAETASNASDTLADILELKESTERQISQKFGRRSHNALLLFRQLLRKPIIDVNQVSAFTELSYNAANSLVAEFTAQNILVESTGQNRNRMFIFQEYLAKFQ